MYKESSSKNYGGNASIDNIETMKEQSNLDTSTKSFGSLLNNPYQIPYIQSLQHERSVESPYTSLGSGRSSYISIGNNDGYNTLKARVEKATESHQNKSKAVMEALQSLQLKIRRLESDRVQAEDNLKSLATETSDYKQLLRQKQVLDQSNSSADSHSKELEDHLDLARNKCQVLEKQLEYMRQIMRNNQLPTSPGVVTTSTMSSPLNHVISSAVPSTSSSPYSLTTTSQINTLPTPLSNRQPIADIGTSSALKKLNELEKEHEKLTLSQNITETKMKELEDKILEERHHRKLLQDKAAKLQQAVTSSRIQQYLVEKPNTEDVRTKRKKKKKRPSISSQTENKTSPRSSTQYASPHTTTTISPSHHYHLDLANIPFVVGQSAGRSHSLGANIQNVLSIMKSHNTLCNHDNQHCAPPRKPKKYSTSDDNLDKLMIALQDEFTQLGIEHREVSSRLEQVVDEDVAVVEQHLERLVEKMEKKGQQIQIIRDQRKSVKSKKKVNQKTVNLPGANGVEIVTTVRAKEKGETRVNNQNLEMLKNVKKLQYTLRKDDLKWE